MAVRDVLKAAKAMREKGPMMVAMELLASERGAKLMMSALAAKETLDRRVRAARDFAGLVSFSDHDKVDRAIGRIGVRLKELEGDLETLEAAVERLEKAADDAPRLEASDAARPTTESLTDILALMKPAHTRAQRAAKSAGKPKSKSRAGKKAPIVLDTTSTPGMGFTPQEPGDTPRPSSALLDINFRR